MKLFAFHNSGGLALQMQTLDKPVITVGRSPDNDIAFDPERDRSCSGSHAKILVTPAGIQIEDVGSTYGTYINGGSERIGTVSLQEADRVQFGKNGPIVTLYTEQFLGRCLICRGYPGPQGRSCPKCKRTVCAEHFAGAQCKECTGTPATQPESPIRPHPPAQAAPAAPAASAAPAGAMAFQPKVVPQSNTPWGSGPPATAAAPWPSAQPGAAASPPAQPAWQAAAAPAAPAAPATPAAPTSPWAKPAASPAPPAQPSAPWQAAAAPAAAPPGSSPWAAASPAEAAPPASPWEAKAPAEQTAPSSPWAQAAAPTEESSPWGAAPAAPAASPWSATPDTAAPAASPASPWAKAAAPPAAGSSPWAAGASGAPPGGGKAGWAPGSPVQAPPFSPTQGYDADAVRSGATQTQTGGQSPFFRGTPEAQEEAEEEGFGTTEAFPRLGSREQGFSPAPPAGRPPFAAEPASHAGFGAPAGPPAAQFSAQPGSFGSAPAMPVSPARGFPAEPGAESYPTPGGFSAAPPARPRSGRHAAVPEPRRPEPRRPEPEPVARGRQDAGPVDDWREREESGRMRAQSRSQEPEPQEFARAARAAPEPDYSAQAPTLEPGRSRAERKGGFGGWRSLFPWETHGEELFDIPEGFEPDAHLLRKVEPPRVTKSRYDEDPEPDYDYESSRETSDGRRPGMPPDFNEGASSEPARSGYPEQDYARSGGDSGYGSHGSEYSGAGMPPGMGGSPGFAHGGAAHGGAAHGGVAHGGPAHGGPAHGGGDYGGAPEAPAHAGYGQGTPAPGMGGGFGGAAGGRGFAGDSGGYPATPTGYPSGPGGFGGDSAGFGSPPAGGFGAPPGGFGAPPGGPQEPGFGGPPAGGGFAGGFGGPPAGGFPAAGGGFPAQEGGGFGAPPSGYGVQQPYDAGAGGYAARKPGEPPPSYSGAPRTDFEAYRRNVPGMSELDTECPHCSNIVRRTAKVCRTCGTPL